MGGREHLCVLDSGAGAYIFHLTLRQKLGAPLSQTPISLPDGSIGHAETFKAPDARIGAITVNKDAPTLSYDLSSIREASGRDIEGIVGLPLFQSHIVQMDFDAHRIAILSPSMSPQSTCGEPIKLSRNEAGLPTVLVEFDDGISERCVVDTGYDGPVCLSSKLYAKLLDKKLVFDGEKVPVTFVSGHRMVREGSVTYLKVGTVEAYDVPVRNVAGESRIGLGYLRQFRVTIDMPHDRIYLAKGAEFDKPGKQRAVGIGLLRKNEKTVVNWTEPDSPAADAGIAARDELLAVAGEPIAGRPVAEIYWMLREKADPSGKLKLMFRRGNSERNVEVTIRDVSETRSAKTTIPPNHPQAVAIAEIQRLGGKVTFDEDAPGKPIYGVDFSDTHIGDEALKNVEALTELKALILAHTRVTDAGLKRIEGLTQLRSLLLHNTRVTDAGLEYIKALVHLEDLILDDTRVTDTSLNQIGGLMELRRLGLSNTRISDAGLKRIKGLPELHSLALDDTRITDEGLKQLMGLKNLERLYVIGTKVTSAGVKELQHALPNLHSMGSDFDDIPR